MIPVGRQQGWREGWEGATVHCTLYSVQDRTVPHSGCDFWWRLLASESMGGQVQVLGLDILVGLCPGRGNMHQMQDISRQ